MKRNCPGFTLIELLLIFSLMSLLFSLGVAQYNRFNRRQALNKAKDELISNLRLAQGKSLAAEKPADCTDTLTGHKLVFINGNNQDYKIVAVCGNEPELKTGMSLPEDVVKQGNPTQEVFFKALSQGVETETTFTLSGFGETRVITVTTAGEIK